MCVRGMNDSYLSWYAYISRVNKPEDIYATRPGMWRKIICVPLSLVDYEMISMLMRLYQNTYLCK